MSTRTIWMYWHQGWDNAPSLVQQCRESWVKLNPGYEVRALDERSLLDHVEFPSGVHAQRKDITIQKMSNLGRLGLLAKYGGVWADATVMCAQPLDSWLEEYYTSRFFAFRSPGPDRMLSTWFIAADSTSVLLQKLYRRYSDFFANNYFSNQGTPLGDKLLDYFGGRWNSDPKDTVMWHSWFARRVLRVYPYFIFHYTFNKLILEDASCRNSWNKAKPFSADPQHRVQFSEWKQDGIAKAKEAIDSGTIPMHKLNWRVDTSNEYWTAVLPYLSRAL